jgi:hypothetical protein
MRENAAAKARRYLTEGRLLVLEVGLDQITAFCRGDGAFYRLGYAGGDWRCDCPARTRRCSHLRALRLVTVAYPRDLIRAGVGTVGSRTDHRQGATP